MGLRSWGVGLCCLLACGSAGAQAGLVVEHGTYSVRLLNHVIGTEDYSVRELGGGQTELMTRSATNDRGSKRETTTTLRMMSGFVPASLTQESVPAGPNGGVQLTVADGVATVREGALSRSLPASTGAAAVFGATPAALQMMAMRTWLAHGRPARMPVLRASAEALPLEIHEVGHEAIYARGRIVKLTRYTVANLVFGREIVWMNDSGRLAGLMTFAGGLPQEEILDQYEDVAGDLMHSGVRQEMLDLAELGRNVKPQMQGSYAIVGARLVDGTGAPAVENATVVVRDGRIVSAGAGSAPRGLRVVHAEGETLLPGLWEMHSHYSGVEFGPALLARGVTTARDCGGELEFLMTVRRAIDKAHALGPHLVMAGLIDAGGPLAFGATDAETVAQGVRAVDLYAELGFEQIKVYTQLKPEVLRAIADEAHRRGMTVTGHVPAAVTTEEGIADGMDQINHLHFVTRALVGADGKLDFGSARAKALLATLAARGIVVDPTESWGEMVQHSRDVPVESFEPGISAAPYALAVKFRNLGTPPADAAKVRDEMATDAAVIGALYRAGVPIVGGSDTGLIGYGLDREMELYVAAGMTPMAAIQTVTRNAARAMRMDAVVGTIAPGKRADFVLVRGNPLEDIRAMREVVSVGKGGVIWDSAGLARTVGFAR